MPTAAADLAAVVLPRRRLARLRGVVWRDW
jgi:hypothetical protein